MPLSKTDGRKCVPRRSPPSTRTVGALIGILGGVTLEVPRLGYSKAPNERGLRVGRQWRGLHPGQNDSADKCSSTDQIRTIRRPWFTRRRFNDFRYPKNDHLTLGGLPPYGAARTQSAAWPPQDCRSSAWGSRRRNRVDRLGTATPHNSLRKRHPLAGCHARSPSIPWPGFQWQHAHSQASAGISGVSLPKRALGPTSLNSRIRYSSRPEWPTTGWRTSRDSISHPSRH